jgi:ABC-2 type transport system ATP-binding protein
VSPPSTIGAAIDARGLVRRFGAFTAVDGVDLAVQPGEIYGFLGPNGAGKSTTVRVLCTLITPDGGSATVAGYDVAAHPDQVRLRIGVALQEAALDPKQTGTELLQLQGRLYGLSRSWPPGSRRSASSSTSATPSTGRSAPTPGG